MANIMEFEGQSEQEAVEKACSTLKLTEGDLDYTVIDEGSGGVFGLGARPVQIKVRVPEGANGAAAAAAAEASEASEPVSAESRAPGLVGPAPEKAAQAQEVAQGLADKMGLAAKVEVRDEHEQIVVVIEEVEDSTDVAEILGKSRPPAIPSFQFLLNKIVNRFPEDRKHIIVEVPSVPRREKKPQQPKQPKQKAAPKELDPDLDPTLVALARMVGERAQSLNKVITIHPMLAADRRAVHQTIMTVDGAQTVSEGEGLYRKMHIVPDSMMGSSGKKKRRRRRRRRRDGSEGGEAATESMEASAADAPAEEAPAAEEVETEA